MSNAPNKVSAGGVNVRDVGPDTNLYKGKGFNTKAGKLGVRMFTQQFIRNNFQLKIKPKQNKEKA